MTGEPITPELRTRILENLEGKLSRADSTDLRNQIKELGYEYGTVLKDCPCPRCKRDLRFLFANNPSCRFIDGGCGKIGLDLVYTPATDASSKAFYTS